MPEGFPGLNVREVNFDERYAACLERVAYCDAGVGVGSCVDKKTAKLRAGRLNPVNQLALDVRLKGNELDLEFAGELDEALIDRLEIFCSIDVRLAATQEVEIGAVQDPDAYRLRLLSHS